MLPAALRHYWYPVALAEEIGERPHPARLLDEGLVLFRAGDRVGALADLCVHRGSPLALGWVDGRRLVCGYHGWAYDAEGACVHIPSLPPGQAIPRKARVPAYRCEERHGLVWVCLDEPAAPIPAFPEYDDPTYQVTWTRYHWQANAARIIENFMDFAHIPFVHNGSLGDRQRAYYESFPVSEASGEVHYAVDDPINDCQRVYRVIPPFTMRLVRTPDDPADPQRRVLFFSCQPVGGAETIHYTAVARNWDIDQPDSEFTAFSAQVMSEDKIWVESQRPEALPVDLAAELHLRGPDTAAVAYRRALARIGVDW